MKNEKFQQLIIDTYKTSKEAGGLAGIVYGAIFTYGFSEIVDINGFVNSGGIDMLYLKSSLTDETVDIYEYDFVDYKINNYEGTIWIKLRSKEVVLRF